MIDAKYNVVPEWDDSKQIGIHIQSNGVHLPDGTELRITRAVQHPNLFEVSIGGVTREAIIRPTSRGVVEISMNGYMYSLNVSDAKFESLSALLRESAAATQQAVKVLAPMPGLLKQISVTDGQQIRKGDKLFILEAMKMENIIKAPAAGLVRLMSIAEGSAVEKGTSLCVLEPIAL